VVSTEPIWVKIGDFGISKHVRGDLTSLYTQFWIGDYGAPEALGLSNDCETSSYTSAVDLWSLGCVIHKVLTGSTPFSTIENFMSYYNGTMEFPVEGLKKAKASFAAVEFLKRLLSVQPADRPSPEEALKDIWLELEEV
jgi:serine/threonine protein kinase